MVPNKLVPLQIWSLLDEHIKRGSKLVRIPGVPGGIRCEVGDTNRLL